MKTTDEDKLILKAQGGDEQAITLIVEQYKGLIISLARTRYLIGGDLEDLIQEGTLGLIGALKRYSPQKGGFGSFAYTGILNKINDAVRADNRDKHKILNDAIRQEGVELGESAKDIDSANPLTIHLMSERKQDFYNNLKALITPSQMQVLKLYLDGYSYKEISSQLNITEKKVDNTLHAIKTKIKKSETIFLDESSN